MRLSELVKTERQRKGWSARELARRAEVDPSVITRIEKGRQIGHADTLAKVAVALGITPDKMQAVVREEGAEPTAEGTAEDLLRQAMVKLEREREQASLDAWTLAIRAFEEALRADGMSEEAIAKVCADAIAKRKEQVSDVH